MNRISSVASAVATAALVATALVGAAGSPTSAAAPTVKACQTKGCKVVTRRDLDGDRKADTTTITPTRLKGRPAFVLRTVTARGLSSQVTVTSTPGARSIQGWPYIGAGAFDGAPGVELLLDGGFAGNSSQTYRMYTWRKGKLVEAKFPGADGIWATDNEWDSSVVYQSEVFRGTREMYLTLWHSHDRTNKVWSGTVEIYQWRAGRWQYSDTRPVGGASGLKMPRPAGGFVDARQRPLFTR